jgi:hypothetical protein
MLSKHTKIIANQCSRLKVIDCVGELLTRRWNAWHSERHSVFRAGGERVNTDSNNVLDRQLLPLYESYGVCFFLAFVGFESRCFSRLSASCLKLPVIHFFFFSIAVVDADERCFL